MEIETEFSLCFRDEPERIYLFLTYIRCYTLKGIPTGIYKCIRSASQLNVSPSNNLHPENQYECEGGFSMRRACSAKRKGLGEGRIVFPARPRSNLYSRLSDSPWSCCWPGSLAGQLCLGCPLCRRDHRSPAWCSPPGCSPWWWECRPPGSSPRGSMWGVRGKQIARHEETRSQTEITALIISCFSSIFSADPCFWYTSRVTVEYQAISMLRVSQFI